jgi:glutathione S-transferase
MLTLYDHPRSGNCHKVRLMLSMLGLEYRSVFVDVTQGAGRAAWFTALNPLQQVPVLVDDEYVVWDSQAILAYLGRRSGTDLAGRTPREIGVIGQWLSFAANEIGNSLQPARLYHLLGEDIDIEAANAKSMRVLGILNDRLANEQWLACGRPTIADLACFPYVGLAHEARLPLQDFRHIAAWMQRITGLEGYVSMEGLPP